MDMERKFNFAPRLKLAEDGSGSFEGYAAVFGNVDAGGDVIIKGAFADAIPKFLSDGFGAIGHDWSGNPINTWDTAKEDDYGLWVKGAYHSTAAAQDARTVTRERIDRGKSVGLSIGYGVPQDGMEFRDDGTRILTRIDPLFEVSHVTVPMNDLARMTAAKHGGLGTDLSFDEQCDWLRSGLLEFMGRAKSRQEIRLKVGRELSKANWERLAALADALEAGVGDLRGMLKDTETPKAVDVDALFAEFLAIEARMNGVTI